MSAALLLDTHVLLWWFIEPERLSAEVHAALNDPDRPVFVSAVMAFAPVATPCPIATHSIGCSPRRRSWRISPW